jgi:hypothetical protein
MIRFGKGPPGLSVSSRTGCSEQPTAAVGPDARRFASDVANSPNRDDLTRERPTVAISVDVEYWAAMTWIPSEEGTQFSAAVCCGLKLSSYGILAATSAVLLTVAYYGERLVIPRIERRPVNRETHRRRVDRILAELREAERRGLFSVDGWLRDVGVGGRAPLHP